MIPWTTALSAIGVKPGHLSISSALDNTVSMAFIFSMFLMSVLAFIPGGNLFNTGEWMVLPFGSAVLIFGLTIGAEYWPRFIAVLAILGIMGILGLGVWFGIARWWDIGGIVKVCLTGIHAISGLILLLRALAR